MGVSFRAGCFRALCLGQEPGELPKQLGDPGGSLAELGAHVHLAHPLGLKMFSYRRVKDDQRDPADPVTVQLSDLFGVSGHGQLASARLALESGVGWTPRCW
jgi:hypothetical protein